jgi:hypothetical protein
MKDWIERYTYDVARRLPEQNRAEVRKELDANIKDMLPEHPSEEDIKQALHTLGHPRILAANYRTKQRYLISPEWMDDYLQVLKIVLVVFGSIALVSGILTRLLEGTSEFTFEWIGEFVGGTIGGVWNALIGAFAVVTLIFAGIEAGSKSSSAKCAWKIEDLPEVPKGNTKKISRTESILGIVLSAVFGFLWVYLLYHNQTMLTGYVDGVRYSPIFVDAAIRPYIPFFVVGTVLSITSHYVRLLSGRYTLSVATVDTVEKVFSLGLGIVFLTNANLLNPAFLAEVDSVMNLGVETIKGYIGNGATGILVLASIGALVDIITTWVKAVRKDASKETAK